MPDFDEAVKEVHRLGFTEIDTQKIEEELFMEIIEGISEEKLDILSNNVADCYTELREKHEATEINKSVESFKNNPLEKGESMASEEKMDLILSIFADWEKGGFAQVEVPEEITYKEAKKLFLTALKEMPFDKKMAGGMTEEIYNLSIELLEKPKRARKASKSEEQKAEEAAYLKELLQVAEMVNQYLENPVTLQDIESVQRTETQLLEMVFDIASEEVFVDFVKDEAIAKAIRKMANERKISSIVVKKKKGTKTVKKWNGEGEPFAERNLKKDPSITYAIWQRILEKDRKISDLNKWATKKFGPKGNGDPRDLTRSIVKMGRKVADFYKISIVDDVVSVTKVA